MHEFKCPKETCGKVIQIDDNTTEFRCPSCKEVYKIEDDLKLSTIELKVRV